MAQALNRYKTDLRELEFVLLEQFGYPDLVSKGPFQAWGVDEAKAVLSETYRFAREVLGPLNGVGDAQGCRLENGQVRTPAGFGDAWKRLFETGFKSLSMPEKFGGQGAPKSLAVLVEEMLSGSNPAFNMYPALGVGAVEVIHEFGTPDQQARYIEKMLTGEWGGTMCLTEAHAGSDVGAATTAARRNPDGTYRLRGTKVFISGGDHDLAKNVIHLVLARVEGAPAGTKGLSLFIVPKLRLADGAPNDVVCASIEHKMGINGSATCTLNFGDNDHCVGELVGTTENVGMSQMFRMMNTARIAVGLQGVGVLSSAYFNALDYARERKQGANFKNWKDPKSPRVALVEHPDVRRMLLEMKAVAEGMRMLVVKVATHHDRATQLATQDEEKSVYHKGQIELLTPLVKAFSSEESFRLCAQGIQVLGGAGYLRDHPLEQAVRDAKIFSIYEGTTHIQAMDLVGRKLGQAGGLHFQQFLGDLTQFVEAQKDHPRFAKDVSLLASAQDAVTQVAMTMLGWSSSPEQVALVPLVANRFLTMMSQLAVGWQLLEAGVLAERALLGKPAGEAERAFYLGKTHSAMWFARNVLSQVEGQGKALALEDLSAMEMPEAAFAP